MDENQFYASQDGRTVAVRFEDRTAAVRKGGTVSAADYHFDISIDGSHQDVVVPVSRDASYGISHWLSDPNVLGTKEDKYVHEAAIDLCKVRILEAVDAGTDFEQDFKEYPNSFVKIFGQDLADLRKVEATTTSVATRTIKKYVSRRLYVAWGIGGEGIEYAQLFDRVDHFYLRQREQDFRRVIDLYQGNLWTRVLEEYPLLTATRALILQIEQEAESAATSQTVMTALTRRRGPAPSQAQARGAEPLWEYDVALSFAGEDRAYVDQVAELLKEEGVSVFYDKYEQVAMWGVNLQEHLAEVYQRKARYVVMFISEHYASKVWPTHERRSAFARALTERQVSVLPVRFDDTELPGLLHTVHYIDLRQTTPAELVQKIREKIEQQE